MTIRIGLVLRDVKGTLRATVVGLTAERVELERRGPGGHPIRWTLPRRLVECEQTGWRSDTDWDLGIDAMAIWFTQSLRSGEVHVIDYHEDVGGGLPACIKHLQAKPYVYGQHWAPHDVHQREISSGLSRLQVAASLGVKFQTVPIGSVEDGIHAVKLLLPRCWFDAEKTTHGLHALRHYRRRWNSVSNEFTATPVHDFASHASDAFRGLATRYQAPREKRAQRWLAASASPYA